MRKVYVEQLSPGMVIGQDVLNEQGQVLLMRGTPLTPGYIEGLSLRSYPAVWITDGAANDIRPPEVLPSRLRVNTSRHLQQLFYTVQESARSAEGQEDEQIDDVSYEEIAASAKPQLTTIFRDAESIVRHVANAQAISGVVSLKSHDDYTYEHSVEVAITAVLLGQRAHLEPHELEILALGCLFHDLGKVMVTREILNKPGKLAPAEFEVMKRHPETGYQLVRRMMGDTSIFVRHIARQHHERQDGKGYPQGLRGTNSFHANAKLSYGLGLMLPYAEIAAVADVYSALASDRPYRQSMSPEEITSTMRQMAGAHLNRELVARFISILPIYPVCTEVVVISPKLKGYRGIVSRLDARKLNCPTIRILYDAQGRHIAPFEVDTGKESGIELATPSYADVLAPPLS